MMIPPPNSADFEFVHKEKLGVSSKSHLYSAALNTGEHWLQLLPPLPTMVEQTNNIDKLYVFYEG